MTNLVSSLSITVLVCPVQHQRISALFKTKNMVYNITCNKTNQHFRSKSMVYNITCNKLIRIFTMKPNAYGEKLPMREKIPRQLDLKWPLTSFIGRRKTLIILS